MRRNEDASGRATHVLKCWPDEFQALADGRKTADHRFDDREFAVGDLLELHEWDQRSGEYSGRVLHFEVTWLDRGPAFEIRPRHVILSLRAVNPAAPVEPSYDSIAEAIGYADAQAVRLAARAEYGREGEIEIDDDAEFSAAPGGIPLEGTYVAAWVWIAALFDDELGDGVGQ